MKFNQSDNCAVAENTSVQSPDGLHLAYLNSQECEYNAGTGTWIDISGPREDTSRSIQVFAAYTSRIAEASWRDDTHLVIIVKGATAIYRSRHEAGGIEVFYMLGPQAKPNSLRSNEERIERAYHMQRFPTLRSSDRRFIDWYPPGEHRLPGLR